MRMPIVETSASIYLFSMLFQCNIEYPLLDITTFVLCTVFLHFGEQRLVSFYPVTFANTGFVMKMGCILNEFIPTCIWFLLRQNLPHHYSKAVCQIRKRHISLNFLTFAYPALSERYGSPSLNKNSSIKNTKLFKKTKPMNIKW